MALADRPTASNGIKIPYVVDHTQRHWAFAAADNVLQYECATKDLCTTCGDPLPVDRVYLGAADKEDSFEPPMCPSCAKYAVAVCPYLAAHKAAGTLVTVETTTRGTVRLHPTPTPDEMPLVVEDGVLIDGGFVVTVVP